MGSGGAKPAKASPERAPAQGNETLAEQAAQAQGNDVPAQAAAPAAAATGQRIQLVACTVGGMRYQVEALDSDTVGQLKTLLVEQVNIPPRQQKLVLEGQVLKDEWVLRDYRVTNGAELALVIGPPEPEWALDLGLGPHHPKHLQDFHDRLQLQWPDYLESNEQVWEKLRGERCGRVAARAQLSSWSHFLFLEKDGAPCGTLRAAPEEQVRCTVTGWIHNKDGDSCIHQLVLVLDNKIVGEVSDGVPGRGRKIAKPIAFAAPAEKGAHMLWRYGDLQYSMSDARQNFERRHGNKKPECHFPGSFVGWLIVE